MGCHFLKGLESCNLYKPFHSPFTEWFETFPSMVFPSPFLTIMLMVYKWYRYSRMYGFPTRANVASGKCCQSTWYVVGTVFKRINWSQMKTYVFFSFDYLFFSGICYDHFFCSAYFRCCWRSFFFLWFWVMLRYR